MRLYVVVWHLHRKDDESCDFGVCENVFENEEKAKASLLDVAEDDFNTWCAEGHEPKMTHDDDWAKVECCFGIYEYGIMAIYKED